MKPDEQLIDQLEKALRLAGDYPGDRALLEAADNPWTAALGHLQTFQG